jgi:hypothetical protein
MRRDLMRDGRGLRALWMRENPDTFQFGRHVTIPLHVFR